MFGNMCIWDTTLFRSESDPPHSCSTVCGSARHVPGTRMVVQFWVVAGRSGAYLMRMT
jgi:hypothetical protein